MKAIETYRTVGIFAHETGYFFLFGSPDVQEFAGTANSLEDAVVKAKKKIDVLISEGFQKFGAEFL